jgi:CBS domain-containing protein
MLGTLEAVSVVGRGWLGASLPPRTLLDGRGLSLHDPAVYAITDFTRDYPVTVDAERRIDDALADMIHLGVRALLVEHERRLVGLITSYDIQGEKPMQFLVSSTLGRHEDLRVAHVMTPWDRLRALDWRDLEGATAADLVRVFESSGLTHLLIIDPAAAIDPAAGARVIVRGLASRARLLRQLSHSRAGAHARGAA